MTDEDGPLQLLRADVANDLVRGVLKKMLRLDGRLAAETGEGDYMAGVAGLEPRHGVVPNCTGSGKAGDEDDGRSAAAADLHVHLRRRRDRLGGDRASWGEQTCQQGNKGSAENSHG